MTGGAIGGRIDPPHLDGGVIPPLDGGGCMIPARHANRHSALLAEINARAADAEREQRVTAYATGGLIPTSVDAPPLNLHLAPDECVLGQRAGKWQCIRIDHRHDTGGIIPRTTLDGGLHAPTCESTVDDVAPRETR